MNTTDIAAFWDRLTDIHAGLLRTDNGAARLVPMSHQLLDNDPTIWFNTARDTDLAEAAEHGPTPSTYVVAEGGKSDPDVCILGLSPETAEVWLTPTSGLHFAFNLARAKVIGEQPDMGSHGTLALADLARRYTAA